LSVTGIIAEFNPLHSGHEYLIKKAKEKGPVVVCLSGNFVQRGDTAIAEKRIRTKMALQCGADLVLELPVLWSMSTAQNFALGGVSALNFVCCGKDV
jgi:cytidyltransferase-like protein